jgi:hypothetical protein
VGGNEEAALIATTQRWYGSSLLGAADPRLELQKPP